MSNRFSRTKKMSHQGMGSEKVVVNKDSGWGMSAQEALRVNYVSGGTQQPSQHEAAR